MLGFLIAIVSHESSRRFGCVTKLREVTYLERNLGKEDVRKSTK